MSDQPIRISFPKQFLIFIFLVIMCFCFFHHHSEKKSTQKKMASASKMVKEKKKSSPNFDTNTNDPYFSEQSPELQTEGSTQAQALTQQSATTKGNEGTATSGNATEDNQSDVSVAVANPLPTEEEALNSITAVNEQRAALNQILQTRTEKIAKIHKLVQQAEVLRVTDPNKPVEPPSLTPPPDIAEKIKSHQLTAH